MIVRGQRADRAEVRERRDGRDVGLGRGRLDHPVEPSGGHRGVGVEDHDVAAASRGARGSRFGRSPRFSALRSTRHRARRARCAPNSSTYAETVGLRRGVVDDEQLEGRLGTVAHDALEAGLHVVQAPVDRDEDRDRRGHRATPSSQPRNRCTTVSAAAGRWSESAAAAASNARSSPARASSRTDGDRRGPRFGPVGFGDRAATRHRDRHPSRPPGSGRRGPPLRRAAPARAGAPSAGPRTTGGATSARRSAAGARAGGGAHRRARPVGPRHAPGRRAADDRAARTAPSASSTARSGAAVASTPPGAHPMTCRSPGCRCARAPARSV